MSEPQSNKSTDQESPQFEHDCKECVFLGRFGAHDLYHCDKAWPGGATVIARYGSEGSQYTSGYEFVQHNAALAEAFKRAKEKGCRL